MAKMNTEELILNFSTQMKDLMKEISEYEQKLNTAKERYLKLQGAVEVGENLKIVFHFCLFLF